MTYEGIRLKVLRIRRLKLAKWRRKKITNKDFTIISNNCWGGMIYESYNLQKQSPTIGCFFMAEDYIKFLSDLKMYLIKELKFIEPSNSKWKNKLKDNKKFGSYPIGKLGDIEIFFLHNNSEEEAFQKWKRRCKRINYNRLIIKFNDQNGCSKEDLLNFIKLPYKNKIFFTVKDWDIQDKCIVKINQFGTKEYIKASYEPFGNSKYININKIINEI